MEGWGGWIKTEPSGSRQQLTPTVEHPNTQIAGCYDPGAMFRSGVLLQPLQGGRPFTGAMHTRLPPASNPYSSDIKQVTLGQCSTKQA